MNDPIDLSVARAEAYRDELHDLPDGDAEAERTAAEESARDMASDEWAEAHPWAMEWLLQHDPDALLAIGRAAILADEHPRSNDAKAELVRAIDAAKQAWTEHRVENRRDYG